MEDPAIYDIDLDKIMPAAINGDQQALDSLMRSLWMLQLLNEIADWAWRTKKIDVNKDGEDIRDIVEARIRLKITTIKNPHNQPWHKCLKTWTYKLAARCCGNVRKGKQRAEERYRDTVLHENTVRIEGGVRITEPCSTMMSQQEEVEQKEQAPLVESLKSKIRQTVRRLRSSFTPEDLKILTLWAEGKILKDISRETHIPLPTVQRRLTKLQKRILGEITKAVGEDLGDIWAAETRIARVQKKLLKDRPLLNELLALSSQEQARYSHALYAGL